jgi:hypothetical protein
MHTTITIRHAGDVWRVFLSFSQSLFWSNSNQGSFPIPDANCAQHIGHMCWHIIFFQNLEVEEVLIGCPGALRSFSSLHYTDS